MSRSDTTHAADVTGRWYVLGVMTLVYALNIADRFSMSSLIEPIRLELHLSDSGVAFLTGVVLALFYVTIGIPVAALADRANRRNIIAASVALWSAMTAVCGLASNYLQLLFGRLGVGIGEAGGTAPSVSLLADVFPAARRPTAMTIYSLGACLGAWLGSFVAATLAERLGWRVAFLWLGFPGLLVALLVRLTVREPRRGQLDAPEEPCARSTLRETLRFLLTQRSAVHLLLGGSVATLWSWGLMWWLPTFLQRSYHMSVGEAGRLLGAMHLVAGVGGTVVAWWLMGTRRALDGRYIARLLAVITASVTVPSIVLFVAPSRGVALMLLWVFVPAVYFFIGPLLGLLQNVTPPSMRAGACAILLFLANVSNLVIAPQVIGWFSDWFAGSFGAAGESLRWALLILAPTGFWAAWHFWTSGQTLREDCARAASPFLELAT